MNTRSRTLIGLAALHLVAPALAEIQIKEYPPGKVLNGAVVPAQASFKPSLKPGDVLVVEAAGKEALRLEVLEGEVTELSTRVKLAESAAITYRRLRDGAEQESAQIAAVVTGGEAPSGEPAFIGKDALNFREKATNGEYRLLAYTQNGFGSALSLLDDGFRVRIIGANASSNQFFLGIKGSFSEKLTSVLERTKATATMRSP